MGRKNVVYDVVVATAGVPVAVSSVVTVKYVRSVSIIPKPGNTGDIFVGDADVASDHCSSVLSDQQDSYEWVSDFFADPRDGRSNALDLSSLFIDAEQNGDGVCVTVEEGTA